MHCLQAPLAYGKRIKKAGGDFTAQDLRNQTESILPSHNEDIKNFMKTRDTKTRISQEILDPWFNAREVDGKLDPDGALTTICEAAGLGRKIVEGNMLITKPRPHGNTEPSRYAVEGYDGYPTVGRHGEVNTLLSFNETFGPVIEIILNTTDSTTTPTLRVRVPCYQNESLDGKMACTPGTPARSYTIDGKPEVSTAYRNSEVTQQGIEELKREPHRDDTWITIITGTESNSILYEKALMAPEPTTHRVEYTVELGHRAIGPTQAGYIKSRQKSKNKNKQKRSTLPT